MHLSIGVTENCKNPDSYGTICVRCNLCGRFDKTIKNDCDKENTSENDCKMEKAMKDLEYFSYEPIGDGDLHKESVEVAIAALQEEIRRKQGCQCCNGFYSDKLGEKIYDLSAHYYEIGDGKIHYMEPSYCPICGRKLI